MLTRYTIPFLLLVSSITLGNLPAHAADAGAAASSIAGTWKWEREFNGNPIKYTLILHQDESQKLTGSYKTEFPNGGGPDLNEPVPLQDARLEGDQLSFTVKRRFNDNDFTVTYQGKVEADEIKGDAKMNFGNGDRNFPWLAKRSLGIDDVVGKWTLKLETPNGVVEPSLSLQRVKDKPEELEGTYHSAMFGDNRLENISIEAETLRFVVNFKTDNGDFQAQYEAKPKGDKISGSLKATFGGQEREMSFSGTRSELPKSEKKE